MTILNPGPTPEESMLMELSTESDHVRPVTASALYFYVIYDPVLGEFRYLPSVPHAARKGPRLTLVVRSTPESASRSTNPEFTEPDWTVSAPQVEETEYFIE